MIRRICFLATLGLSFATSAAPVIDPLANVNIPAGKSLTLPVTASSPERRPLTFTVTSSTNRISVEVHTNNPFWKMSVVQAASSNAPGAFETPFRGGSVWVTNIGDMTFMLFKERAPRTVDVIAALTTSGFYNSNTIFHRVVPGFVIQGGDPNTNGGGGPIFRYDDEFHPRALFAGNGQLALANSGKDTDGSQFFVTLGPQRFLDLGYTLFGQLLRGFNVLTNIGTVATNASSRPLAAVIITRASLVPNTTDTVITLTGTNLANVSGTIRVIADDGAGGKTTNSFTATTVADANNDPPILYPQTVTNRVDAINARLTNTIAAFDLEGNAPTYSVGFVDGASLANASNSTFNTASGVLVVVPNTGYAGPIRIFARVAPNSFFSTYDQQTYSFAFGDTPVAARGTNFIAFPLTPLSNQLLATFTNGIAHSAASNFTASINWGDNATNAGTIVTNLNGQKEVRGSHTFTNSGNYAVYITITSSLGADATVVSTATVPPNVTLSRAATTDTLRWPAWAFDYSVQSNTNLATATWAPLTNPSALSGYENVVTNGSGGGDTFFRLKK